MSHQSYWKISIQEYVQFTGHFERVILLGQFAGCCHVVTYVRCQAGISGVSQANLLREGLLSIGGVDQAGGYCKRTPREWNSKHTSGKIRDYSFVPTSTTASHVLKSNCQ